MVPLQRGHFIKSDFPIEFSSILVKWIELQEKHHFVRLSVESHHPWDLFSF
jgi:hypothetical protein